MDSFRPVKRMIRSIGDETSSTYSQRFQATFLATEVNGYSTSTTGWSNRLVHWLPIYPPAATSCSTYIYFLIYPPPPWILTVHSTSSNVDPAWLADGSPILKSIGFFIDSSIRSRLEVMWSWFLSSWYPEPLSGRRTGIESGCFVHNTIARASTCKRLV